MPICSIDASGFHRATKAEIRAYIEASKRGIFELGPGVDLSSATLDGQWIDKLAETVDELIDVVGQVYAARSPAGAVGAQLARLVRLNGVTKNAPERSTGTVTLIGDIGTRVPSGSRIGNAQHPEATFETVADVVIEGPTNVSVRATETGPVPGDAGDLTVPMTVISGWASVTNDNGVSLGNLGEPDVELRARREISVALPSQGIVDGLRAHLLQLPDVTEAVVRENPEDTVQTLADGGTLAPHAIQVIVRGGAAPADIAAAIALRRVPGCTMVGAEEVEVVDAQGVPRTIKYDEPDDRDIYVNIHTPAALTGDEEAAVREAIVARGKGLLVLNGTMMPGSKIGEDVAPSDVWSALTALQFTTLPTLKVSSIDIGTAPAPAGDAEIAVAYNQVAAWDPDNITFESP